MLNILLQAATPEIPKSLNQLDVVIQKLIDSGLSAGKHIIAAVIIFIVGRFLIKLLNRLVASILQRRHIEQSVQTFLSSLVNIILTILLIITVIGALGVNTTSFAALIASAGVAIGMALSGNLQNLFNNNYVVDAYTSSSTNGTWENAYRVFYNFGRTYTMKLRVNF